MYKSLKAELVKKGVTTAELAKVLGLSRVSVSHKLNGRTPWKLEEAQTVANLVGGSVDDLFRLES